MTYTRETGRKFWYDFDKATKYTPSFMAKVTEAGAGQIQVVFNQTRKVGQYPAKFKGFVDPRKPAWQVMAKAQTDAITAAFGSDWADLQRAFEDFGQGVLYDSDPARGQFNDMIHTMDVQGMAPAVGYHRWHASIRAIQVLGIGDSAWWEKLASLVGLTWAIQSFAKPKQQNQPNPDLSAADLDELRQAWKNVAGDRLDRQYDLTGDTGYHPHPKSPVA